MVKHSLQEGLDVMMSGQLCDVQNLLKLSAGNA